MFRTVSDVVSEPPFYTFIIKKTIRPPNRVPFSLPTGLIKEFTGTIITKT